MAKQTCHFVIIYSLLTNNTKVLLHKKRIKKTEIELLQNVDMLYFCKKIDVFTMKSDSFLAKEMNKSFDILISKSMSFYGMERFL